MAVVRHLASSFAEARFQGFCSSMAATAVWVAVALGALIIYAPPSAKAVPGESAQGDRAWNAVSDRG